MLVERLSIFIRDKPISSSERMLYKNYDHKGLVEKQKSQGVWRQDELVGGKPPVVK
jgi:hypothetical protein